MQGIKDKGTGRFIANILPKECSVCDSLFKTYSAAQTTCSRHCGAVVREKNKIVNGTSKKGIPRPQEVRDKISKSHIGIKPSAAALAKMRIAKKGKPSPMLGKHHSTETKLLLSIQRRGEKGSQWRGGTTELVRIIRRGIKYRTWRMSVFKRDNFTCVWCGANKKYLNADHIEQFALLLRKFQIKSVEQAESCDELWEINNGRTLCLDCHKETDTYLNKGKKFLEDL